MNHAFDNAIKEYGGWTPHDPARRLTIGPERPAWSDHNPERRSTLADIVVKSPTQLFRSQVAKDWEERQSRRNSEIQTTLGNVAAALLSGKGSQNNLNQSRSQSRRQSNITRTELPLIVVDKPHEKTDKVIRIPFIQSLIHSFIHTVHLFIHSFIHSSTNPFIIN